MQSQIMTISRFDVFRPTLEDVQTIREFIEPYFDESIYSREGLVYCPEQTIRTLVTAVMHESVDMVAVRDNSTLAGIAIVCYNASYFKGFEGDLDFFYVSPSFRGTGAARVLVSSCLEVAKERKANVLYCGCHSGMDDGGINNQMFVNLFKKQGFVVNGTNLQWFNKGD